MAFFILPLLSARDLDIGPEGFVLIYLSHILPGQITCYCPRKMLLHRRQITRRKLCFYYTCKFGVISIKYVIIKSNTEAFRIWWTLMPFPSPIHSNPCRRYSLRWPEEIDWLDMRWHTVNHQVSVFVSFHFFMGIALYVIMKTCWAKRNTVAVSRPKYLLWFSKGDGFSLYLLQLQSYF
jgi:hypothetical protein